MLKNLPRKHWLAIATITATLIVTTAVTLAPRTKPVFAPRAAATYYVDNNAATDGDGSLNTPWNNIAGHVDDLAPGDTMCVRGDPSAPGRVYTEATIDLIDCADGTEGAPITVRTYPGEHVVIHSTEGRILLNIRRVDYWHFEGLTLDGQFNRIIVVNLDDTNHSIIRNCEIRHAREGGVWVTLGDYNIIENCEIHDFDHGLDKDAHGIALLSGHNNVIRNNTIYNARGDCILFIGGPLSGSIIENNHLYTTLGPCSENALDIKTGSPIIRSNTMHGFRYCDGSCGGTGGGESAAIVIHEQAAGIVIDGNEIYDTPSGITLNAPDVQIINNLIHDLVTDPAAWANIGIYVHHSSNVDILNNTLAHIPHNALWISKGVYNLDVRNNLFYDTNQVQNEHSQSEVTADYNGWFSTAEQIEGPNDVAGDNPLLTADYHLTKNSPARGAGENGVDLGAFPYTPHEETPTPESTPTTESPLPTPTLDGEWWSYCPPCPTYPVQPTLTPRPTPTCRPCHSPTPYPTGTPYPPQPEREQ